MNSDINLLLLFLFFATILLINYWASLKETILQHLQHLCVDYKREFILCCHFLFSTTQNSSGIFQT